MSLFLREVTAKDVDLIFEWANDKTVRENAFHTEQILYDDHRAWFVKMLSNSDVRLYILCDDMKKSLVTEEKGLEIGQIRFNFEQDVAVIGYSVSEAMRHKGYGAKMVCMAEEKIKSEFPQITTCLAQVKYQNLPSAKVFEKCGYDREDLEQYIEFTKKIR